MDSKSAAWVANLSGKAPAQQSVCQPGCRELHTAAHVQLAGSTHRQQRAVAAHPPLSLSHPCPWGLSPPGCPGGGPQTPNQTDNTPTGFTLPS